MSSGVLPNYRCDDFLVSLLAEHTVEEEGHNAFFENALKEFGIHKRLLKLIRPLPTTFEWIHLMRSLTSNNPFSSALCSGLLEYTAKNQSAIKEWHDMLIKSDILSETATMSIYEHVKVDTNLGHGSNWKEAILKENVIDTRKMADALNSVSTVAEMFVRFLDALETSSSANVVKMLANIKVKTDLKEINLDTNFMCNPIYPSSIYHQITHNSKNSSKIENIISIGFALSSVNELNIDISSEKANHKTLEHIKSFTKNITNNVSGRIYNKEDVVRLVKKSWLNVINGHSLREEMLETSSYSLVYGWIFENYYYISQISAHVCGAINSTTDPLVRSYLVKHLEEELNHGEILKTDLVKSKYNLEVTMLRPLPTTISFVGALISLAKRDWKAYVIVLYYLQMTLDTKNQNLESFYSKIKIAVPETSDLISTMEKHDKIDAELSHEADADKMLDTLFERNIITFEQINSASVVVQLLWSFLDGIRSHYKKGDLAVFSRIGWH